MAVKKRRIWFRSAGSATSDPLVRLWMLRALVPLGGFRALGDKSCDTDAILEALDLQELACDDLAPAVVREQLRAAWREAEARRVRLQDRALARNLDWLRRAVGLSQAERQILSLAVMMEICEPLRDALETLGDVHAGRLASVLSGVLGLPRRAVAGALEADSALTGSGLIRVDTRTQYALPHKLELLHGLADTVLRRQRRPAALLQPFFYPSAAPALSPADYPHIERDYTLVRDYLAAVKRARSAGVNILVYGEPGTGKTELVRLLAAKLGLRLHEITMVQPRHDEAMAPGERFRVYRLAQGLLARAPGAAILFDEIEDVFPEPVFFPSRGAQAHSKAWVNRLLQENPVPTFWLSNQVGQIDPAFLRRFDFVLPLSGPTRAVRRRMFDQYLAELPVSEAWRERMAEHEALMPAHIERAAKVARLVGPSDPERVEQTLERVMGNTLEVLGHARRPSSQSETETPYDLEAVNADTDLAALASGLKASLEGRLCLYGPPGTGKTAFGRYLAKTIDRPLLIRRASDILSMWVGESEKHIAHMFRQAEDEGAVLLLDEADGFFQDRRGAHHSWEVTQVNELLVQMEGLQGIFIASTNLMEHLDDASLRRFDVKIRFAYLKPEQAWQLFQQTLTRGGVNDVGEAAAIKARLAGLANLTPGDFATVLRRLRISGRRLDAQTLALGLVEECRTKHDEPRRGIGYTAS